MELGSSNQWYRRPLYWGFGVIFIIVGLFVVQVARELRIVQREPSLQTQGFTPLAATRPANVPPAPLVEATSAWLGPAEAPLQIVEFADFDCPFSQQAFAPLRRFAASHPTTVRLVYRHFPLDNLHPQARPAAVAAHCAQAQGKFWIYFDKLYLNSQAHAAADLERYAAASGLDVVAWQRCLVDPAAAAAVEQDFQAGLANGVQGTPTFFINGYKVTGALPPAAWDELYRRVLEK